MRVLVLAEEVELVDDDLADDEHHHDLDDHVLVEQVLGHLAVQRLVVPPFDSWRSLCTKRLLLRRLLSFILQILRILRTGASGVVGRAEPGRLAPAAVREAAAILAHFFPQPHEVRAETIKTSQLDRSQRRHVSLRAASRSRAPHFGSVSELSSKSALVRRA